MSGTRMTVQEKETENSEMMIELANELEDKTDVTREELLLILNDVVGPVEEMMYEQRKLIEEQREEIDKLKDRVGELEDEKASDTRVDGLANNILEKVQKVEDKTERLEDENEIDIRLDDKMTAIERAAVLGISKSSMKDTKRNRRAVTIFENIKQDGETESDRRVKWGGRRRGCIMVETGEDSLKTLMEAETGEELSWVQIYRAMETVADSSDGKIEFKDENEKHDKRLEVVGEMVWGPQHARSLQDDLI